MSRRNRLVRQPSTSHRRPGRSSGRRLDLLDAACAGPLEHLESRTMLTIVQGVGQDYLAFEAEHPEAVFTDLDSNGQQWRVIGGSAAQGASTLPSAGAAIQANRAGATGAALGEGKVTYPIQLTNAGPYLFYARVKYSASGGDNSMFVPPDAGDINADPSPQWDNRADAQGNYHWNNLDLNGVSFDYNNPTPGAATTFSLEIREHGYIVDRIVLSETPRTAAQLDALMGQQLVAMNGPQTGQVTVIYTPVAGATSYNILRGTSATGPFNPVGSAAGTATQFIDTTVPAGSTGQTFYYVVEPVLPSGPGTRSGAAPVVIGAGARGSYYNDHFWGSGGRDDRLRAAGGIVTFRPGPNPDVTTFVNSVDFDWGTGTPHPAIRPDNHSTVFTGKIRIPTDADGDGTNGETIDVTFVNSSDDDGIIFVNGVEAANHMGPPGHGQVDTPGTPLSLVEGQSYNFSIFQAEQGGGSGVRFKWQNPATGASEVVPGDLLTSVTDVPTAPTLGAGTVAPTSGDERMVSFDLTDNSVSELWFELLRDGVVVATAQLNAGLDSNATAPGNQARIVDAQPTPGPHQYAVRAVNFDGTSATSAAVSVTVPADYYAAPANGASGYYFNSASWSGGRTGTGLSGGPDIRAAGHPDFGETVSIIDFDYGVQSPNPSSAPLAEGYPLIQNEAHSTVFTGEVLIPEDGDATPGETIAVQFVGNTDDHGVYYVNGQIAATSWIPRGQGDYTGAPPMNLVEGQRYDFVILQAEQFGGSGVHFKWVNPATGVTEAIPNANLFPRTGAPAAPTAISQNGNFGALIILNWTDNSTNEVRYELERSDNAAFTSNVKKLILPINSTTYTDLDVQRPATGQTERQYFYRVSAINYEGTGQSAAFTGRTVTDEAPPAAPTNLRIRAASLTTHTLSFVDNALNDAGFVVERRNVTTGGTFAPINGSPFPGTFSATGPVTINDNDATLVPGNTYEYQVFAINAEGERSSPALVGQVLAGFPGGTGLQQRIWDSTQEGANSDDLITPGAGLALARIGEPGLSTEGNPTAPLVNVLDPSVDDGYGNNAPDPAIGADTFAIEWVGEIYAEETKPYEFSIVGDDGVRLYINDRLVIDGAWVDQGDTEYFSEPINLTAGQKVKVRFQMYEQGGGATARLRWNGANNVREAIPTNFLFPTIAADDAVAVIPFRPVSGAKAFALPGLAAESRGPTIAVTWQDNAFGEAGYEVQRATNATFTTGVTTWGRDPAGAPLVNAGRTVFVDNGTLPDGTAGTLDNNTTYFYRVRPLGAPDTAWVVAGSTKPVDVDAAAQDMTVPNFASPNVVVTNGDATQTAEGSLRLSWNRNDERGSAYLNRSFDVSRDFKVAYEQQIGSGNDADGMSFVMHNFIPTTAGAVPTQLLAIGGGGGALAVNGFTNSVAVIFDFHDNIDQMGVWTNGQVPPGGFIAATRTNDNGVTPLEVNGSIDLRLAENGSVNLDANQRFRIELSYDAEGNDNGTPTDPADDTGVLTVVMKDAGSGAVLNTSKWAVDLETTVGDATSVMGWTAANGGLNERYEVHSFSYDGAGVSNAVVSEVYVRGTAWSANFRTYMEGQGLGDDVYGYRVDNKTGDQRILPWVNANEIVLRYNQPPTGAGIPTPGTVTLTGDRPGGNYTVTSVTQLDPQTFVLALDRPLGNLSTGGENGVRVNLVVPASGPGGGNFSHVLNALQGDVAHGAAGSAHSVVAADFSDVKNRFFRTTSAPGPAGPQQYTVFHDVDGSGGILANDFSFVKARFFDSLQTTPFPVAALSGSSITKDLFASGKVIG